MLHPLIGALCSLTDPRQGPQWLALLLGAWLALGVPTRAFAQDLAPPPTTQAEVEASQQVAEGERLRAAGQYQEALARYRAAYRLHPSEAPLRAAAEVYRLLGDHASAYTAYETLLRRHYAALSETAERSARQALAGLQPLTATIAVERFAPGATIAINGIVIGKTPLPGVARVNPGRYTVTVARPGYEILTRVLQLTSGATSVSGPLQQRVTTGEVAVSVDLPVLAELYVDGHRVGSLPWRGPISRGDHTFQAVGPGHQSDLVRVTVQPGAQTVRLTLVARPGRLVVHTGSDWARIIIDGTFLGYGHFTGELAAGQHELRIELSGYQPHTELFTLHPGAELALDRRASLRPLSTGPPQPSLPGEPTPPRKAEPDDDSVGVYGAFFASGTFATSATHQYATDCPVLQYGGDCSAKAAKGGGLGLRLGFSLGVVGIEGLLTGGADVSFARASLPVTFTNPVLQRFAEESTYVRTGWAPGLGLRLTSAPAALRVTAAGAFAYAFRKIHPFPDTLEGDTSVSYRAPTLVVDAGILAGSNPGAKLFLGVFAWFEFTGNVTLQRNLSALGASAQAVPPELAQVDIYQGTQVFWGPMLGIGFGH